MLFLLYLILLMMHANHFYTESSIYPIYAFEVYFVINELYQIKVAYKSAYFSDPWNLMDIAFISLLFGYSSKYYSSENKEDNLNLLALVNLLSWMRGLSQLRCFQETRIFIYLVVRVITIMAAFAAVTLFGIITLSTTHSIMEMTEENEG